MPGFAITGHELWGADQNPASLNEVRRQHRWLFEALGYMTARNVLLVLKSASRPSFQFEEPVMHHNQEQVYFAGKHTWEPISLSWYDVQQDPDVSHSIYEWLGNCINLDQMWVNPPRGYKDKLATLKMVDGRGDSNEEWTLWNGWPQSVNWNAVDYSTSDLQLIEVKYRFDRATKVAGANGQQGDFYRSPGNVA